MLEDTFNRVDYWLLYWKHLILIWNFYIRWYFNQEVLLSIIAKVAVGKPTIDIFGLTWYKRLRSWVSRCTYKLPHRHPVWMRCCPCFNHVPFAGVSELFMQQRFWGSIKCWSVLMPLGGVHLSARKEEDKFLLLSTDTVVQFLQLYTFIIKVNLPPTKPQFTNSTWRKVFHFTKDIGSWVVGFEHTQSTMQTVSSRCSALCYVRAHYHRLEKVKKIHSWLYIRTISCSFRPTSTV